MSNMEKQYKSKILKTEYKMSPEKRAYFKNYKSKYRMNGKDKYQAFKKSNPNYYKNYQRKMKEMVIDNYGGKCICCDETTFEFLSIDHINGNGGKHRKSIGGNLYQWLIKNDFPKKEFALLCHNCNFAKGIYGKCPHVEKLKE